MNLAELAWPDVAALSRDTPVIFPVAALEQHGRHLPLFTDSLFQTFTRGAVALIERMIAWDGKSWDA